MAGSWAFKELARQRNESIKYSSYENIIHKMATQIYEHECQIIYMIFQKGKIDGIEMADMLMFVGNRIDVCLEQLGMNKLFEDIPQSPINEWFYKGINNYKQNDFFNRQGREYVRGWAASSFTW